MQEVKTNIEKNRLRKSIKELRNAQDSAEKAEKDRKIAENLFSLKEFVSAQKILCYISEKNEVDTENIVSKLFRLNKTVAAPRVRDSEGNLDFYEITSFNQTQKSAFGVREPIAEKCKKLVDFSSSVCILPALAFDINGYRLGYGKGCYDRFLGSYSGFKIGICYENCIFDALPKDEFDIAADIVVTENRIIYIKKETGEQNGREKL